MSAHSLVVVARAVLAVKVGRVILLSVAYYVLRLNIEYGIEICGVLIRKRAADERYYREYNEKARRKPPYSFVEYFCKQSMALFAVSFTLVVHLFFPF